MGRSYAFRVVWAFVLAPIAAAIALGVVASGLAGQAVQGLSVAVSGLVLYGYPVTFVLALPLYLVTRRRIPFHPVGAALAGAILAVAPVGLLDLITNAQPVPGLAIPSGTAWTSLMVPALCGGVGGLVFWLVSGREAEDSSAVAS